MQVGTGQNIWCDVSTLYIYPANKEVVGEYKNEFRLIVHASRRPRSRVVSSVDFDITGSIELTNKSWLQN